MGHAGNLKKLLDGLGMCNGLISGVNQSNTTKNHYFLKQCSARSSLK
jgi:hypothetical protein